MLNQEDILDSIISGVCDTQNTTSFELFESEMSCWKGNAKQNVMS